MFYDDEEDDTNEEDKSGSGSEYHDSGEEKEKKKEEEEEEEEKEERFFALSKSRLQSRTGSNKSSVRLTLTFRGSIPYRSSPFNVPICTSFLTVTSPFPLPCLSDTIPTPVV